MGRYEEFHRRSLQDRADLPWRILHRPSRIAILTAAVGRPEPGGTSACDASDGSKRSY